MKSKVIVFLFVFIIITLGLIAAENGDESHDFWSDFLKKAFNSVILFGGLFYLLRKPLIKYLSGQSVQVEQKMKLNKDTIIHKLNDLNVILARLAKIEQEIEEIKKIAREQGHQEGERMVELGKQEAERILTLTEKEIEIKMQTTIKKLRENITKLSIEHFKQSVSTQLDDELHQKIIEKNIEACGDIID